MDLMTITFWFSSVFIFPLWVLMWFLPKHDITHKIVGDVIYFKTGLSLQPSKGHYFEVVPRSSISKLPLMMANSVGVIDENYRGEILVPVRVLHKNENYDAPTDRYANGLVKMFGSRPQSMHVVSEMVLSKKPKLFQAILRKRNNCDFVADEVTDTDRSDGGFGSTDNG